MNSSKLYHKVRQADGDRISTERQHCVLCLGDSKRQWIIPCLCYLESCDLGQAISPVGLSFLIRMMVKSYLPHWLVRKRPTIVSGTQETSKYNFYFPPQATFLNWGPVCFSLDLSCCSSFSLRLCFRFIIFSSMAYLRTNSNEGVLGCWKMLPHDIANAPLLRWCLGWH